MDGNIQDHPDQGVAIRVVADVAGKETTLRRFNCFAFERSYIYGPENPDLRVDGRAMLGGTPATNLCRMESTVDGNPIGWTIRTLGRSCRRCWGARSPSTASASAGGRRAADGAARPRRRRPVRVACRKRGRARRSGHAGQ